MSGSMIDAPARSASVVTPSDSTTFKFQASGLYIGTGGNVNVLMSDGNTCLFSNVPTGAVLPVRCNGVYATSTTASNIVALFC